MPSSPLKNLCDPCWTLLCSQRYSDEDVPETAHHTTGSSLEKSLKDGCWICVLFWRRLQRAVREAMQESIHEDDCQPTTIGMTGHGINIRISCCCPEAALYRFYGRELEYDDLACKPRYSSRHPPSSKEALDIARHWLHVCQTEHSKCQPEASQVWYPTRLIDLRQNALAGTIRLVVPQQEAIEGFYMTLSHCWGPKPFFCLTQSTLDTLMKGLRTDLLTKTFAEAVKVCLALGVDFLWIDSLCIIQDSEGAADWLSESQHMEKIYSNALCNISATASSDGTQGLLRVRTADLLVSEFIEFSQEERLHRSHELFDTKFWQKAVEEAPLQSRGWVFQERLIASRILHFTDEGIMWECSQLRASESCPYGLSEGMMARENDLGLDIDSHLDLGDLQARGITPDSPEYDFAYLTMLYDHWWRLLAQYLDAKLTFADDRPLAIAAIAKRFEPHMNDTYSGGMWQKRFYTELLWQSLETAAAAAATPPRRKYTPPSFSWLSANGVVVNRHTKYSHQNISRMCRILSLELDHVTSDHTGIVNGGLLRLQGALKRIQVQWSQTVEAWILDFNPMQQQQQQLQAYPETIVICPDTPQSLSRENGTYFCFPMATNQFSKRNCWCLILALEESGKNLFRRVGAAPSVPLDAIPTRQDGEDGFPCTSFDVQIRQHVVSVV